MGGFVLLSICLTSWTVLNLTDELFSKHTLTTLMQLLLNFSRRFVLLHLHEAETVSVRKKETDTTMQN